MSFADIWRTIVGAWRHRSAASQDSPQFVPIPIDREYGLVLFRYDGVEAQRFATAFAAAWNRLPADVQYRLDEHWTWLRREFSRRRPKTLWPLPVIGVYPDFAQTAIVHGRFLGQLLTQEEGYWDLDELFGSAQFAFCDRNRDLDTVNGEQLEDEIGIAIASYYLKISNDAEPIEFLSGHDEGAGELAASWGFAEQDFG